MTPTKEEAARIVRATISNLRYLSDFDERDRRSAADDLKKVLRYIEDRT